MHPSHRSHGTAADHDRLRLAAIKGLQDLLNSHAKTILSKQGQQQLKERQTNRNDRGQVSK